MANRDDMMQDLVYGDMLTTSGYDVEFAVGTTYSMDMKALLIVPYSLGMFGDLGSNVKSSPVFLLESIRRSSNKFALFCHRGGIHMPHETQSYYPLVENSIFEVQDKPLSNFHPKLWVIREHNRENEEQRQIKVVIMSKNLTFDNNLDVVVSLTGEINTGRSANSKRHKPLKDMLERLATFAKGKKRRQVLELAEDLYRVKRFEVDDTRFEPDAYEFVPYMFGECLNENVSYPESFQGETSMTISPFIDIPTIKDLTNVQRKNGRHILVTRTGYITEKVFSKYNREGDEIYVMNDQMVNNDRASIDLHAKMYYISWPKAEAGNFLYLGSANATYSAFHKNAEILLRLKFKSTHNLFERFKNEFLQMNDKGESDVYELVREPNPEATENTYTALEETMRHFVCQKFKAKVSIEKENGLYDIEVATKDFHTDYHISIAPLQMPTIKKSLGEKLLFENLPLSKLSEFYVICVENDEGESEKEVIKIPTDGIPNTRDDEIFRSIVDTKEKFYNYISFMLCDDPEEFMFEIEQAEKMLSAKGIRTSNIQMPSRIYEQMLQIASKNPEQLLRLDDVTRIVKDTDFSTEFNKLYEQFRPLIPKLKQLL